MTLTVFLLVLAVAVALAVAVPVAWGLRPPKRQPTEYELQIERMRQGVLAVQITITDEFTPALQRAALAMDEFARAFSRSR